MAEERCGERRESEQSLLRSLGSRSPSEYFIQLLLKSSLGRFALFQKYRLVGILPIPLTAALEAKN